MTHFNRCGDVDSDGDIDVVACAFIAGEIQLFENLDGAGGSWESHPLPAVEDVGLSGLGDLDGDGDLDVVCSSLGPLFWFENADGSGHSWLSHIIPGPGWNRTVWPVDIDLDGDLDILTTYEYSIQIYAVVLENLDGHGGSWQTHTIDSWKGFAQGELAVADIDSDGDQDIAVSMYGVVWPDYPGQLVWCENLDGVGMAWASHPVQVPLEHADGVFTFNPDGDGDQDIGCIDEPDCDASWWENIDGAGQSWVHHQIGQPAYPIWAGAGDFDGDGDQDIACASDGGTILYRNLNGAGGTWDSRIVDGEKSTRLSVADLDSDGSLDVAVSCSSPTNKLSWYDVSQFRSSGTLVSTILDTGCDPQWASIDWTAIEPSGTDLSIQYRSSNDPGNLGSWSSPIQTPCYLSGLLDRYFQYQVNMTTTDPSVSPILFDISLNWDPTGIEGPGQPTSLRVSPSPASGQVQIEVSEGVQGQIRVIDVAGRVVATLEADGSGSPQPWDASGMPAGIYTVLFSSSEWTSTARVVVIH